MKISVIVPIYNMEKYLDRCIESIINQTYKELEIILVNDGSTDKSLEMCEKYSRLDTRIKVIDKKNGGLSSARNVGLDNMTGEYVYFVDPDDYIDLNTFEELIKVVQKYECDLVLMNFSSTFEDKEVPANLIKKFKVIDTNRNLELKEFAIYLHDEYRFSAFVFGKFYHKDIFKTLRFPYGRRCEDGYIVMSTIANAKKIVLLNKSYYHYWQRAEGLNKSGHDDKWEVDWIESRMMQAIVYNEWCKHVLNNGYREYMLYRAYRNALLFMPESRAALYADTTSFLKSKLIELSKGNLSFRHKLSIWKVLFKYKLKCKMKGIS